jgi:hypothetical protein
MKARMILRIAVITAFAFLSAAASTNSVRERIGARCWEDVRILADDAMEGRRTGSAGHRRAAQFVADGFRNAGLEAGAGGYLQEVRLESRQIVEANSSVKLVAGDNERTLEFGDDAGLLLRGDITPQVTAPLVFVGHGLRLPQYGIDDLQGLDLQGKVVVSFMASPASVPGSAGAHFGSPAEKWKVYKAAGAVGVMFMPNPHVQDLPWERAVRIRLEPFMVLDGAEDLYSGMRLWVLLNPARFALLLEGSGHDADELLALLEEGKPLPHFDLSWRVSATVDAKVSAITSENVVGVLPGSDPALRDELVVLSAHLDHLGIASAGQGNGSDRLFNGAMDNASGIAVLMQVARDLSRKKAPRRTLVFAAVTAEELGLLGSRAYVADARSRGQHIVANLNTDMFMPLYPMKRVLVFGLDESDLADDARAVAAELGIEVQVDPQPERNRFIRSDQYSFIRAGIPALATKIGVVADSPESHLERKWLAERYHAVSDSADQPVDLAAVGTYQEFTRRLAVRVANRKDAPRWHDTSVFAGPAKH